MHNYGARAQVDHRLTMSETPLQSRTRTPSPCFRANIGKASCLTGSLRRKTWGDKAGRRVQCMLAVTRGVTPPRCRFLLNARSAWIRWRARKDSNLRPPDSLALVLVDHSRRSDLCPARAFKPQEMSVRFRRRATARMARCSSAGVHACPHMFIGHPLDTNGQIFSMYLILLALPRGLEPLFSP